MKNKWTWKNGRLWHPTEAMSLSTEEAFNAQEKNGDIGRACEGVLTPYSKTLQYENNFVIAALKFDLAEYNKRKPEARELSNG